MTNPIMVAEIGINHNGSLSNVFKLIDLAVKHKFDYVKFQKRNIDICYTEEYLNLPRVSPWGHTQREQKEGLEFSIDQYKIINAYCEAKGIKWFYSAWDIDSADKMLNNFNCDFIKIARACNNNKELIGFYNANNERKNIIVSFNPYTDIMSNIINDIKNIKFMLGCVSLYPAPSDYTGFEYLFNSNYRLGFNINFGYSNHSDNWIHPVIASFGEAKMIEVHITLDKTLYGSDQSASLDDTDLTYMMQYKYSTDLNKIKLYKEQEEEVLKKLRQTW